MKINQSKIKKIKISLTGEIDIKDIISEINFTAKENSEMEYKKYTWTSIFIEFILPIVLIFALFIAIRFFGKKPYIIIVFIPLYYAYFFYRIIKKASPHNINYLRKLADAITVFSALVTAILVVFNSLEISLNSIIESGIKSAILFFISEVFATFASIKLFFSVKDFNDERKKGKNKLKE